MVAIEPRLSPAHSDRGYPFLVECPLQERNVYSIAMASFSVCTSFGNRPSDRVKPESIVSSQEPCFGCDRCWLELSAMYHAFSTGSQQEQEVQDGKLDDLNTRNDGNLMV